MKKERDAVAKSRLEYLDEFIEGLESGEEKVESAESSESNSDNLAINRDAGIKFTIQKKKFYFGNAEPFDEENEKTIAAFEAELDKETDEDKRADIRDQIKMFTGDYEIFEHCHTIMSKQYIYNIDGLIFTPISLVLVKNQILKSAISILVDGIVVLNGSLLMKILLISL